MTTLLPRVARSALSETSSRSIRTCLFLSNPRISSFRAFSSSPRAAATTPTSSYTSRSTASRSTPPPTAAKDSPIPSSTTRTAPSPTASRAASSKQDSIDDQSPIKDMTTGLADEPLILDEGSRQIDWATSFHGLSSQPFSKEAQTILMAPIPFDDVEVKPDGIIYLPEIKYRRILNKAFGPGGWGLAPRGETIVTGKSITREYALVAHGRLVSVARGEQDYFSPEGIPTATEGCKSNALMRCCKDLGVASELWDPRYIRKFMKEKAKQIWVEHVPTKKKKQMWLRQDDEVRYPYKAS